MAIRSELSPAKRALLDRWSKGEETSDGDVISCRPPGAPPPLSFSQQRQLFLELLEPGTAVNNLWVCFDVVGPLDLSLLERSAARMLVRHETLRTRFVMDEGVPRPEVTSSARVRLPVVDLEHLPEEDRLTEALRRAKDDALDPVDLGRAPLLRLAVYRLDAERHVLFVLAHHTIADGWSLDVFLRELLALYGATVGDGSGGLPDLEIQYGDYAYWQRERVRRRDLADDVSFWRDQLEGAAPHLELPVDHPRGSRQTFAGATHHFRVARGPAAAARALAQESGTTLFVILCAAFDVLLLRYTGEEDICVGTPTAGRDRPEVLPLIGSFINTIVLRADLSGDPSFTDLVERLSRTVRAALSHQDLPFERLVVELKPERDLARTPLFQTMFNLQSVKFSSEVAPGLTVRPLPLDRKVSQFDLTFIVSEDDGGLVGSAEYNSDLFEPETIERMARSYVRLLEQAVAAPSTRISQLRVMDPPEEGRLLSARNRTDREYPRSARVHELVEAQAERTPDRMAVVDANGGMTYGDVVGRLDALAGALRGLGVVPGEPVGVCVRRSADMIPTLLAVLKSGGTYVPLHPSDPPRRVERMLSDAGVRVLIAGADIGVPGGDDRHVVRPDEVVDAPRADRAVDTPPRSGSPDDPAYIMYTSGSTGRPKGVEIPHGALVNFLWSMAGTPGLEADDVLLAVTSPTFDISALELYLPLLVGARVVVASDEMRHDPFALAEAIERYGVTTMQATPATWRMMIDSGWGGAADLRCLCGGEALDRDLAASLLERVGTLWNLYGPTETTVWSSVCRVRAPGDVATIGEPIANTQLYVLDDHMNPVPPGVRAELCIGGDGLALGYLNEPRLTAERFPPDPFQLGEGRRLYRTGDAASYLPDGRIALHGRRDNQIKIQGFRVELGEVESALSDHPEVRQAVAAVRGNGGGRRLVAYYVPDRSASAGADELRAFLGDRLPAYMLPSAFVPLDEVPVNTSGKVDRSALPAPHPSRPELEAGFVAPRDDLERALATVYARVLGLDCVGVHDNFFDLGGGSLQILEIMLAAQDFDIALAPEMLFQHQTVAELAAALSGGEGGLETEPAATPTGGGAERPEDVS